METPTSIAARSYATARPATAPDAKPGGAQEAATKAAEDFASTLQNAEDTAKQAMVGKADPHALVQALADTQLAVETAVTLRDKVVQAYQEILRMPV